MGTSNKSRGGRVYEVGAPVISLSEGAVDVHVKTIHTNMVNQNMHFETTDETLFAIAPNAQDRSFTVVDATGFAVDDRIQIENGLVETDYPTILSVVGNVITIDRPLDKSYNTTTDGIRRIVTNMAVDGSLIPVSFKAVVETTESIQHITRILFSMVHGTAGDMGKFGDIANGLTRGVLLRAFYKRTNEYKTVSNWKTNQDMASDMYDVRFDNRSTGGGDYGTSGRLTFANAGIVVELEPGEPADFLEVLIQDNLTSLTSFTMNAQGHTED